MSAASFPSKAVSVLAALSLASAPLMAAAPAHALANARPAIGLTAQQQSLVRLQLGNTACSATMITSSWALTARHCIPEGGSGGAAVGSSTLSPFQEVSEAIIHPTADLALVKLRNPVNTGAVSFYGAHVKPGANGVVAGWGGYAAQGQQFAQEANVHIDRRITNLPSPDRSAVLLQGTITGGRLLHGDSGGPLFINGQLAGVLSMSTAAENNNATDGTVGWYVPVAEHAEWIARHSGARIPAMAGSPAPVIDATANPTVIPAPQDWALGSF